MQATGTKTLILLPVEDIDTFAGYPIFEFEDPGLQNLKISSEIQQQEISVWKSQAQVSVRIPSSLYEKTLNFYSGKTYDDVSNYVVSLTKFGLDLAILDVSKKEAIAEYKWIKKNEMNGTIFYDGSAGIDEHLTKIKASIAALYPKVAFLKEVKLEPISQMPTIKGDTLLESSLLKIAYSEKIIYALRDTGNNLMRVRHDTEINWIDSQYLNQDVQESPESKAIRLRILERTLAGTAISNCSSSDCEDQILSLVHDPYLCKMIEGHVSSADSHYRSDVCLQRYADYDAATCNDISDSKLWAKCPIS